MVGLRNLVMRNERLYHGNNSVPPGGVALPFILVQVYLCPLVCLLSVVVSCSLIVRQCCGDNWYAKRMG
jgi:hypothetical protein